MSAPNHETFVSGDPTCFEAPAPRLGARAVRARRRTRRLILVWWIQAVLLEVAIAVSLVVMAIRAGRGYLAAALVCLGCVYLANMSVRVVRSVRRIESYPDRHWERFRGCLPVAIAVGAILVALMAVVTFGLLLDAEPAVAAATGAAVVYFVVLLMISQSLLEIFHHVHVSPYFDSRVGEIATFAQGYHVARHVLELDELAVSLGVTPLSTFGWNDDLRGEPLDWHSSAAGLKTCNALLARIAEDDFASVDHAGIVEDLKRIAHALDRADQRGIRFCLILDHGSGTSALEFERRKGTFF